MYAMGLGDIYTFGPTFRAENSNTTRHAAEFWMIEPEMAFADIYDDMDLAEDMVRSCVRHVMEHCAEDLELFDKFVEPGLLDKLNNIVENGFARITYAEAIEIMKTPVTSSNIRRSSVLTCRPSMSVIWLRFTSNAR